VRPGRGDEITMKQKTVDQLTLAQTIASRLNGNGTAFKDPAFMENRGAPVHRWVPWIAGYSSTFVDSVLKTYIGDRPYALVLDPFAGVGTTLFQSAIYGYDVCGFEINPYACMAAEAKLNAFRVNIGKLDKTIDAFDKDIRTWNTRKADYKHVPLHFKSRIPFFSPKIEKQVLHVLSFIETIQDKNIHDLFSVAFGAVMVSFSNYTYEPSLSTRPGAGKPLIENADVGRVISSKLIDISADIAWLKKETKNIEPGEGGVYNNDFFTKNDFIESNSIHLMVTSPPYLNNYHYARNTRPQLYWLGLINSPEQQKPLETQNFGTFWQIARVKEDINLDFNCAQLASIIKRIRIVNESKGVYGGRGWANYAAAYFNDVYRFMSILHRVLRRNGVGVVVVGNSILQGINIPVQDILGEIGKDVGLTLDGIYELRSKRVGDSLTSSSVRSKTSKVKLSESAVIFRKK